MALNHPVYDALKNTNVILASTSERRKEILDKLGINYVAVGSNFAEDLDKEALGPSEVSICKAVFVYSFIYLFIYFLFSFSYTYSYNLLLPSSTPAGIEKHYNNY